MTETSNRQPILGHLVELRGRLIKASAAIVVGSIVAFFYRVEMLEILSAPYEEVYGQELIYIGVMEGFSIAMRIALFGGLLLASPVVFYQMWAFVNPALSSQGAQVGDPGRRGAGSPVFRRGWVRLLEPGASTRVLPNDPTGNRSIRRSRAIHKVHDPIPAGIRDRLPVPRIPLRDGRRRSGVLGAASCR